MKFHVWCLDLDDVEEDACSVESGEIGMDIDTRLRIVSWPIRDARAAAERYAEYCHRQRDGWECTWPLTFRVRSEDGTVQDFEVDREMDPVFSARPVKTKERGDG